MDIPGLSTLYAILKRHIERQNDVLAQRKHLADELLANCRQWSSVLVETFTSAAHKWEGGDAAAAIDEIVKQQEDFLKLDYWSIEETSPILLFLREDPNFEAFAKACAEFYVSALSVKRLVYQQIEDGNGVLVTANEVGVSRMVTLWCNEVERMLQHVTREHMRVRILTPK